MTAIDPYVRVLFLREVGDLKVPTGHVYKEEMLPHISKQIREVAKRHGARDDMTDIDALAVQLFNEMLEPKAITREDHGFAGVYYVYSKSKYQNFRTKVLENDPIQRAANRVQGRYFRDQFSGYQKQREPDEVEFVARGSVEVPASDRVVSIGDNGAEFIEDIQVLREALRVDNDEDGKLVDRRERLDRELSASQELFKSKSVRVKAVMSVLVGTLYFISTEFAGGIIGELAVKLLEQIRPLMGV